MIIGFFKTLGILFAFIAFIGLITAIFVEVVVFLTKAVDAGKRREEKREREKGKAAEGSKSKIRK